MLPTQLLLITSICLQEGKSYLIPFTFFPHKTFFFVLHSQRQFSQKTHEAILGVSEPTGKNRFVKISQQPFLPQSRLGDSPTPSATQLQDEGSALSQNWGGEMGWQSPHFVVFNSSTFYLQTQNLKVGTKKEKEEHEDFPTLFFFLTLWGIL